MNFWTLISRTLRYYARPNLGILVGCALATAILAGALLVGDSVRQSLRLLALARVGKIEMTLYSKDRFFRAQLADDLAPFLKGTVAPALHFIGAAASEDRSARANRLQVTGVDPRFWSLATHSPTLPKAFSGGAAVNERLATHLKIQPGASILLRIPKPSQLSRDAPISPDEDFSVAVNLSVVAILKDSEFGRFGLQADQVPPYNVFVPLEFLQSKLDLMGRANLLLAGNCPDQRPSLESSQDCADPGRAAAALKKSWQLSDAGLEVRQLTNQPALEVRSQRVFIEAAAAKASQEALPEARPVLTYFVNEMRSGDKATPYSMVTAAGPPLVPAEMKDNEVIINQWLADDLRAKPGEALTLTYYVVGISRKLEERTNTFRVRAVVPLSGAAADPDLMPSFPGLADADNCRDWETGFPIEIDKIRERDEKYWDEHRGTPKAFVTLAAGQAMWQNRFGELTGVRYPSASISSTALTQRILSRLDPATLGLTFQPLRQQALEASAKSMDFGGLFLGFSFFLILAALLLITLLFQFGVEQRSAQVGTLLALGFTSKKIRLFLLLEGLILAALGALIGLPAGALYARAMLWGLTTVWQSAVGTRALDYHARPETFAMAGAAGIIISTLTIWAALRSQIRRPARELLAGLGRLDSPPAAASQRGFASLTVGLLSLALAIGVLVFSLARSEKSAGLFFASGALALLGCFALLGYLLRRASQSKAVSELRLRAIALRNCGRRRRRSLATVAMFACGTFLVAAIGVFRLEQRQQLTKTSGTGGFALLGEAALPITQDLNSKAGREFFGLDQSLPPFEVVSFRVRDGDDASCLNLNRAQKPRLLGVSPEVMAGRFTFTDAAKGLSVEQRWNLLNDKPLDDTVPAIADKASITWALGKKTGDILLFQDDRGQTFKIRLVAAIANSILQGSLVISESNFVHRFPGESGYRIFLIDTPAHHAGAVAREVSKALQSTGLEVTPTEQRLAAFNAVQNTYLSTFQALGGLGLLLGSIGLGIVVLRNVLERQGELALLRAVGFQRAKLRFLVMAEHAALLLAGLFSGLLAASLAVLPSMLTAGSQLPSRSLFLTLVIIFLSGFLWTWLATAFALRGPLLAGLRTE